MRRGSCAVDRRRTRGTRLGCEQVDGGNSRMPALSPRALLLQRRLRRSISSVPRCPSGYEFILVDFNLTFI